MRVLWMSAIFAVACGDNEVPPTGVANGSTLVARFYETEGAAVLRDWQDTHNDVACTFQVASDGRWRCLPTDVAIGYGDAACTKPIGSFSTCGAVPHFVLGPEVPLACGDTGRSVYAVEQPTSDQAYYYTDETGCHRGNNGTPNVLYALHEVPVTGFVAAELVHEGGGRIQPYAFHAEDGAVEATSTWDRERDAECSAYGTDATSLCEPAEIALAYDTLWGNATCTEHAAVDLSRIRPCATPSAILSYRDDSGDLRDYYEIGERIANPYSTSGGACAATTGIPGDVFYGQRSLISNASFVTLDRVLDGTGRVRALRYDAGTPLEIASILWDTTLDEVCTPYRFTDGTARCVTAHFAEAAASGGIYADASCTQPLALASPGAVVQGILVQHVASCGDITYESFAVGAAHTGMLYGGAACQHLDPTPDTTYLALGDATDLPILVER